MFRLDKNDKTVLEVMMAEPDRFEVAIDNDCVHFIEKEPYELRDAVARLANKPMKDAVLDAINDNKHAYIIHDDPRTVLKELLIMLGIQAEYV